MELEQLKLNLKNTDHSIQSRYKFAALIHQNPNLLPKLLTISKGTETPTSFKAMWVLEFVCKEHLDLLLPHISNFLKTIQKLELQSAIRPAAKICEYLCVAYYDKNNNDIIKGLTKNNREQITSICFDWLINPKTKVASKAYSMSVLYWLGTEFTWIHPELKLILEQQYLQSSAAYKARARMVLKKLK